RADLPAFEGEQRAALAALATLTGRTPAALDPVVAACTAPPRLTAPLPAGDGTALLARRADIRQAERRLAADTARIGVAVADLYPTISILGSGNLGAQTIGALGTARSVNYSIGPLISWRFPIQSIARARIRQAEATAESSLASFDGTVLTALRETEQALARLDAETRRNEALARAAAAANAARLSRYRFDYGADSFLRLLDSERERANTAAALAASNSALVDNQVDLFRALGGGWEAAPPVADKPVR
ncbi:MAG: TolC family protein, partial [Sphingomonas sp.]